MSVVAVMLVKDEADIIEFTIRHLAEQVDQIIVADNLSTDGTLGILERLSHHPEIGPRLQLRHDAEVGYYQARKTTELAVEAVRMGHTWVVPCDADEFWYASDRRPIRDFLPALAPDVVIVQTPMYYHVVTPEDPPDEPNPFRRLGWRIREQIGMPKVACRLHPRIMIEQGNHSAFIPGSGMPVEAGLVIRHFTWRSEEQYVRKLVNGAAAYAATNLPESIGEHWRKYGNPPNEEAAREWFREWGVYREPGSRDDLIYDPAPYNGVQ